MMLAHLLVLVVLAAAATTATFHHAAYDSALTVIEPSELSSINIPISYAQFAKLPPLYTGLQGYVTIPDPPLACTPITNAEHIKGTVAMIDRGDCEFYTKVANLEKAGAIGFLISNVIDDQLPSPTWGENGVARELPVPGGCIYGRDGAVLRRLVEGGVPVRVRMAPMHLYGNELP